MTPRRRVLAVYKQAEVHEWDNHWHIYFDGYCMGSGKTVALAWSNAVKRLEAVK
jgi:hypothetical protein